MRTNRSATIRRGLGYQDLCGFRLCLEILRAPDEYSWIQFETAPDDTSGAFFLDDIVLQHKDGTHTLVQVKHRQNPTTEPWTWEILLAQEPSSRGSPKRSLLQKWALSTAKAHLNLRIGELFTNGLPDKELEDSLKNGKIDVDHLKATNVPIFDTLVKQLGAESDVRQFATQFVFCFSQPDLAALEDETRSELAKSFCATKAGIDNLLLAIKDECEKKVTEPWDLQTIVSKCEFSAPRHLNEDFSIPADFQLFDTSAHADALKAIEDAHGGIQVFFGNPGSGKSTYLSWLSKTLSARGFVVLRHHYHINPADPRPLERISARRVIEALKAQCRDHCDLLGPLAVQNAENVPLRDFLGQIASRSLANGKVAVLVVDGLDHALRYEDSRQLKTLLEDACVPQDGLWILLGTQLVAKDHLPQIVFDRCPEKAWIPINGLAKEAVSAIIRNNQLGLSLPRDEQLTSLVAAIWSLCAGNPLHLRYTLSTLMVSRRSPVTEYDCRGLHPYDGDIARYYDALWRKLPDIAKSLALCLVAADFEPTQDQLCQLAAVLKFRPDETTAAINSILHLLHEKRGRIRIYHNSFRQFLLGTGEFVQQKDALRRGLRDWLAGSAFEDLKWAHLRILEYHLGNPAPLLELNRKWAVDALSTPRSPHQIEEQLKAAAEAAFKTKRWGLCFEFATLRQYVSNAIDSTNTDYISAWNLAYELRPDAALDIQSKTFAHEQLVAISRVAYMAGTFSEIEDDVISALNDRHYDLHVKARGEIGGVVPEIALSTIDIVTCDNGFDMDRIFNYIRDYSASGWAPHLIGYLARRLIALGRLPALADISKKLSSDAERSEFLRVCAELGLMTGDPAIEALFDTVDKTKLESLAAIFCELKGRPNGAVAPLAPHAALPDTIPEYDSGHREHRANVFAEAFTSGVSCGLTGREATVSAWNSGADAIWAHRAYSALLNAGVTVGQLLKAKVPLDLAAPVTAVSDLEVLQWPDDRDRNEYEHSLRLAIRKMFPVMVALSRFQGRSGPLNDSEVQAYRKSKHFGQRLFVNLLDDQNVPLLSKLQLETVVSDEVASVRHSEETFSERAARTLRLARIARCHSDLPKTNDLLKTTCNYFVSYGSHKDPMLNRVMDGIRISHRGRPAKTKGHIDRIAPLALGIREYTDGDDTRYFPEYLADILADTLPEFLPGYFVDQAKHEGYYLAERVFSSLVRSAVLTDSANRGVASTAIDHDSFEELGKRAASEPVARDILQSINEYFGELRFESDRGGTSGLAEYKDEELAAVSIADIESKIESLDQWNRARFLSRWARIQRRLKLQSEGDLLAVLDKSIDPEAMSQVESEVLDVACELAISRDREKAFQYVTWAQANANGWEPFFSSVEESRGRWKFIQENYADRYLEFFQLSIERSGLRYHRESSYFMPVPRGVEFLGMFGQWDLADEIMSAAVDGICALVVDSPSASCPWLTAAPIDGLGVLLQRLVWPSPLVRERAATALSRLLTDASTAANAKARLLQWLSDQRLESMVVIGLLPFAQAAPLFAGLRAPFSVAELTGTITANSIVSQLLLEYIAHHLGESFARVGSILKSAPAPRGYVRDQFFDRTISSFLPPAFLMRAERVQEYSRDPFVDDWANTAESIGSALGLEQDSSVLEFMGQQDDPLMVAMSTMQSEVYRSAYLRCLTDYFNAKKIPEDIFLDYAMDTVPIDMSVWRVAPGRRPAWWPSKTHAPENAGKEAVLSVSYDSEVQKIVDPTRDPVILAAAGRVTESPKGAVTGEITIIAFGYRVLGARLPSAEQVYDCVGRSRCESTPPSRLALPLAHLESWSDHLPSALRPERIGDVEITPLVGRHPLSSAPSWQWFRMYYSAPSGLSRQEFPGVETAIKSDRWSLVEGGSEIGASYDWTDGILDRQKSGMPPPCGHYLELRREYLEGILQSKGLRIAFAVRSRFRVKEESYGKKPQEFEATSLVNFSPIITPKA